MVISQFVTFQNKFLVWLLSRPRSQKRATQLVVDVTLLVGSFFCALLLRLESLQASLNPEAWLVLCLTLPVTLLVFIRMGFYRAIVRYISARAFRVIAIGVGVSAITMLVLSQTLGLWLPRSVPFIYALIAMGSIGAVRFVMRAIYRTHNGPIRTNVLIYGAGESGRQLFHSLHHGRDYRPVGFIDDNSALHGAVIGGLTVFGPKYIGDVVSEWHVSVVLLAVPSASRARRAALIEMLEPFPVRVQTIPGLQDLISGAGSVSDIRNVSIKDILGRDPVAPKRELMDANIAGKSVFVSGAGGSIGSELCRQIIAQGPRRLVLYDLSEYSLYAIDQELKGNTAFTDTEIVPLIGSVQNQTRLEWLFGHLGVDTVYHAAAYKHVPLVEHNMIEGVRNNVFGTRSIAQAAARTGVAAFILVSTDKAVRPTNVMGATKRMAELICQGLAESGTKTLFSMVRFGNVLGSSGSVIPTFARQIEQGGPVTVTHPDITRYFMTIPEAAQLVIQAGGMARGGDVFVLDMGDPVKIADLAAHMIRLSGHTNTNKKSPDEGEIQIEFTGLRPGEKLYEELLIGDDVTPTVHERIRASQEQSVPIEQLNAYLGAIEAACDANDLTALRHALSSAPIAYTPQGDMVDITGYEMHAKRSNVA